MAAPRTVARCIVPRWLDGMRRGDDAGWWVRATLNVDVAGSDSLFAGAMLAFTLLTIGMLAVCRRRLPLIGRDFMGRCGRCRGGKPLGKQQYKKRNE